ncbi:MAG TPA: ABC transporter permease [Actinocrinis sp.]
MAATPTERSGPRPAALLAAVLLPLVIAAAVLAFAWPAARIAPRDLPLGIVGAGSAGQSAALALQQAEPGAFDLTLYPDEAAARAAIEDREVYGALDLSQGTVTALTASAAGPTVAQLIDQVAQSVAGRSAAHVAPLKVVTLDVVPTSAQDPRGLVISSALLPLTMCGVLVAAVAALLLGLESAWRQLIGLAVLSAAAGLAAFLVAQGFLGALPNQHLETWGVLSLTVFAMSCTVAGLVALFGTPGLGLGSALMVFVGNPFSGATSAPELLPKPVGEIGQLLPPGAGASLLRSTAYFGGHGPVAHLVVLAAWSLFGLLALVAGHHSFIGHAARRDQARTQTQTPEHAHVQAEAGVVVTEEFERFVSPRQPV